MLINFSQSLMYVISILARSKCKVILHIQALDAPPLVDDPPVIEEPSIQINDLAPTYVGKDPALDSFTTLVLDDYDLPLRKKRKILVCV